MQAKLIKSSGEMININPKDGKEFSCEELRAFVGGHFQMLNPASRTGAVMFCNEEGKLLSLPLNRTATIVWQQYCEPGSERSHDFVVGDVVICHKSQVS